MRRAVALSRLGYPAPNPHVGCVVVLDGEIVGEGHHEMAGGPHAEVIALRKAGRAAQGADLYVTLEPCAHHGRTPPCTDAIIDARIRRVFIAVADPNPIAAGGAERLREAGIEVSFGMLAADAEAENLRFLTAVRRGSVFVTLKAAVTIDGLMARADCSSKWITSERARSRARLLRAEMGAVLVGWRTIANDDAALSVRSPDVRNEPMKIVVDPSARLRGDERVFADPSRVLWLVAPGQAKRPSQIETELDPPVLVQWLYQQELTGVLVEGGPETIRRFAEAGVADRLHLFTAPRAFGEGLRFRLPEHIGLRLLDQKTVGGDLWTTYAVDRRDGSRTKSDLESGANGTLSG